MLDDAQISIFSKAVPFVVLGHILHIIELLAWLKMSKDILYQWWSLGLGLRIRDRDRDLIIRDRDPRPDHSRPRPLKSETETENEIQYFSCQIFFYWELHIIELLAWLKMSKDILYQWWSLGLRIRDRDLIIRDRDPRPDHSRPRPLKSETEAENEIQYFSCQIFFYWEFFNLPPTEYATAGYFSFFSCLYFILFFCRSCGFDRVVSSESKTFWTSRPRPMRYEIETHKIRSPDETRSRDLYHCSVWPKLSWNWEHFNSSRWTGLIEIILSVTNALPSTPVTKPCMEVKLQASWQGWWCHLLSSHQKQFKISD